MGDELEHRVQTQAQAALTPLGLVIDDLSITRAGKRRLVRIAVDDDLAHLAEGDDTTTVPPVTLDTVADATRAIDAALDAADPMGQAPYVLEVTSPGTSRPLIQPRHFRRNVGRLVTVQLADGTSLTGRIVAAGTDESGGIRLEAQTAHGATAAHPKAAGTDANEATFVDYASLTRAQVQVEFNRIDEAPDEDLEDLEDLEDIDDDTHGEDQED